MLLGLDQISALQDINSSKMEKQSPVIKRRAAVTTLFALKFAYIAKI